MNAIEDVEVQPALLEAALIQFGDGTRHTVRAKALRLFAVWCAQRAQRARAPQDTDDLIRVRFIAIETAARHAAGLVDNDKLRAVYNKAVSAVLDAPGAVCQSMAEAAAGAAVHDATTAAIAASEATAATMAAFHRDDVAALTAYATEREAQVVEFLRMVREFQSTP